MVSASESGAPPEILASVSHGWFCALVAVQVSAPFPAFEIRSVSANVTELPALALRTTLSGVTLSTGCWTVNVTRILAGEPVIAPAFTVTVSVCVPAVVALGSNVSVRVAGGATAGRGRPPHTARHRVRRLPP